MQKELERIRGGEQLHGALTAWELRDAILSGSHVYKHSLKHRVDVRKESWLKWGPGDRIASGVMSCSYFGSLFFGHAIKDDIPLTLLAQQTGQAIRSSAQLFAHQDAYLRMVRLESRPYDSVLVDRLTIFDDHNQSASRIQRTREVRSRMQALFPSPGHAGVFIDRKGTGDYRRLANERQVVDLFVSRGFAIVDPDQMTAAEIQKLRFRRANRGGSRGQSPRPRSAVVCGRMHLPRAAASHALQQYLQGHHRRPGHAVRLRRGQRRFRGAVQRRRGFAKCHAGSTGQLNPVQTCSDVNRP